MLTVNNDRYHTTNRTAICNWPFSLARAAGFLIYVYKDGITVLELRSGTLLMFLIILFKKELRHKGFVFERLIDNTHRKSNKALFLKCHLKIYSKIIRSAITTQVDGIHVRMYKKDLFL